MSKANKILLWVVLVLVAILAILLIWQVFFATPSFYAVYMKTGDLYFGRLVKFPSFELSQVYTIQVTQDAQNPVRIQKFADAFWGPGDSLKLNKDEVVWYTKLDSRSQLSQLLETNPDLTPQQVPQQQLQQIPQQQIPLEGLE